MHASPLPVRGEGQGEGNSHSRHTACSLLTLLLITTLPTLTHAAEPCRTLNNDAERLACYDRAYGTPSPAAPPATQAPSALERREERERELQQEWFALTPHRPNYILPATYLHDEDFSVYSAFGDTDEVKDVEAKYQLSVRTLLWPDMFGSRLDTWFAFTLQSYWQVYAGDISAPFRETNYEPELFVSMPLEAELLGWKLHRAHLGLVHQSNGRSEPLSRSWNRVLGRVMAENGNFAFSMSAWWRLPEDDADDDNPHIERYMGQGELGLGYRWNEQTFALLVKNNFRSQNKSGVQLDWSFPLIHHLKGYVQIYSGYGENLIDGPNNQTRAGLGIMLTDWL